MADNSSSAQPAPSCSPARLTTCIVVALVVLRLAVGWHFWREGTKKLHRDSEGHLHVEVPSEAMFSQAVGPFAEFYHSKLPDAHQWQKLLAVPREQTAESAEEVAVWAATEANRIGDLADDEPFEPDTSDVSPVADWEQQIVTDFDETYQRVTRIPGLGDEQQEAAAARVEFRKRQLGEYLAGEAPAIAEWQHELWRLKKWQDSGESGDVPFVDKRIAEKAAETAAAGRAWVTQVQGIERGLANDLKALAIDDQGERDARLASVIEDKTTDEKQKQLDFMNLAVTCLIIGVGFCLLLGLLTRLAALGGMVFLLTVMATQPPWVPGANLMFFYYQFVEFAALGVLLATAAGRYAGLDFFLHALWRKLRGTPATA